MRKTYLITGGLGFVGRRLVSALVEIENVSILIVDDALDVLEFKNSYRIFSNSNISFRPEATLEDSESLKHLMTEVECVIHLGAIASTDRKYSIQELMYANLYKNLNLIGICGELQIPLIYASSAAVYGNTLMEFGSNNLDPINAYAFSKLKFEQECLKNQELKAIGLRLFNVYGPGEEHKGNMKSVPAKMLEEALTTNQVKVFRGQTGASGFSSGSRDFIHIDDVIAIILHLIRIAESLPNVVIDVGTGLSITTEKIAQIVSSMCGNAQISYVDLDYKEIGYQMSTLADTKALARTGFMSELTSPEAGIRSYLSTLLCLERQEKFKE
jgi:ADP-L-glycero-D-manno-heptose 6-epimerase